MQIQHQFQGREIAVPLDNIIVRSKVGDNSVVFQEKFGNGTKTAQIEGEVDDITAIINSKGTTIVVYAKSNKGEETYHYTPKGELLPL